MSSAKFVARTSTTTRMAQCQVQQIVAPSAKSQNQVREASESKSGKILIQLSIADPRLEGGNSCFEVAPQPLTGGVRPRARDALKYELKKFASHQDPAQLRKNLVSYIGSAEALVSKRVTIYLVEFLVATGIFELRSDPVLFAILKSRIELDKKIKEMKKDLYYSIRQLAGKGFPDSMVEENDLVSKIREILSFSTTYQGIVDLINELDPEGEQFRFNLKKVPLTFEDCLSELKKFVSKGGILENNESFVSWLTDLLSRNNFSVWIRIFFSIHQCDLVDAAFKILKIPRHEKTNLIESNISAVVEGMDLIFSDFAFDLDKSKKMAKWILENLSYHPLGGYSKKKNHFPLCQKLFEISQDTGARLEKKSVANMMLNLFNKTKLDTLCKKLASDFYSRELEYGHLGFEGLHRLCYTEQGEKYFSTFFTMLGDKANFPIFANSFIATHCKSIIETDREAYCAAFKNAKPSSFFSDFFKKIDLLHKKVRLDIEVLNGSPLGVNDAAKMALEKQYEFVDAFLDRIKSVNATIGLICFREVALQKAIGNATKIYCVKQLIPLVAEFFSPETKIRMSPETARYIEVEIFTPDFVNLARENVKKVGNTNERCMSFLSSEIAKLAFETPFDFATCHPEVLALVKRDFLKKMIEDVSSLQASDEGEVDAEFFAEVREEVFQQLLSFVRAELKVQVDKYKHIVEMPMEERNLEELYNIFRFLREYTTSPFLCVLESEDSYIPHIQKIRAYLDSFER
jgi:hypothetical protein